MREDKLIFPGKTTSIELEQHSICEGSVIRGGTFPGMTRCRHGINYSSIIETRPKAVKHGKSIDKSDRSGQIMYSFGRRHPASVGRTTPSPNPN